MTKSVAGCRCRGLRLYPFLDFPFAVRMRQNRGIFSNCSCCGLKLSPVWMSRRRPILTYLLEFYVLVTSKVISGSQIKKLKDTPTLNNVNIAPNIYLVINFILSTSAKQCWLSCCFTSWQYLKSYQDQK